MSDKAAMKREIRRISQYNSILFTRYSIFAGLILGSIWFRPVTFYILLFYLIIPHILRYSLSGSKAAATKKNPASTGETPIHLPTLYIKYRYDAIMHQYQSLSASLTGFCLLLWGVRLPWPQNLYPLIMLAGSLLLRQAVYWFYRIRIHFLLINNSL